MHGPELTYLSIVMFPQLVTMWEQIARRLLPRLVSAG